MKKVGVFEGKTHFSALIEEAAAGQIIVVTKNGRPVAQIGPVRDEAEQRAEDTVERILAIRKQMNWTGGERIRELIDGGRRH